MANEDAPGTRFNVLSETVSKQGSMLQQINTHVTDIQQQITAITLSIEKLTKEPKSVREEHSVGPSIRHSLASNSSGLLTKGLKIDLFKYDGTEDPSGWTLLADQYFLLHQIPPAQRLLYASFHLKGATLQYYKYLQHAGELNDWVSFIQALEKRFGPTEYEDPEGELSKLRQTSTVAAYQSQFENLAQRIDGLLDRFLTRTFISGLKDDIKTNVNSFRPTSLKDAIGLARLQEKSSSGDRRNFPRPQAPTQTVSDLKVKKISFEEMKEHREKGLCYNCDEKFRPGHKCKSLTLFLIDGNDYCDEDMDCSPDSNAIQHPEISLHAIAGATNPETMRVTGYYHNKPLYILLDSGSTHNFLDPSVASKLNLPISCKTSFDVMVANGDRLYSEGQCQNIFIAIQGVPVTSDFYLLSLGGYDAVLGAHWLQTLGPILWDFSKLTMEFCYQGKTYRLAGIPTKELSVLSCHKLEKLFRVRPPSLILDVSQIYAIDNVYQVPPTIQAVIDNFSDMFCPPLGLPSTRYHDHRIILPPGTSPTNVRPYRYLML
jgi:uncharacterized coiled-coil protein SlyX